MPECVPEYESLPRDQFERYALYALDAQELLHDPQRFSLLWVYAQHWYKQLESGKAAMLAYRDKATDEITARGFLGEPDEVLRDFVPAPDTTMVIWDVLVGEKYRRRGLGSRLIKDFEDLACNAGKTFVALTVATTNDPAIRLYEKCGYQAIPNICIEMSEWVQAADYEGVDQRLNNCYIMIKSLASD